MKEILKVTVGSIAQGTNTPTSDTDVRRVYVEPTATIVGIGHYQKAMSNPGEDDNSWELAHFCYLALRNNPQTLEVLLAPYTEATEWGWSCAHSFPISSKGSMSTTHSRDSPTVKRNAFKAKVRRRIACENVRHTTSAPCGNGYELLREGSFTVRIHDVKERSIGDTVYALKTGEIPADHALALGAEIEHLYNEIFDKSPIPLEANKTQINDFLVHVRRTYLD